MDDSPIKPSYSGGKWGAIPFPTETPISGVKWGAIPFPIKPSYLGTMWGAIPFERDKPIAVSNRRLERHPK